MAAGEGALLRRIRSYFYPAIQRGSGCAGVFRTKWRIDYCKALGDSVWHIQIVEQNFPPSAPFSLDKANTPLRVGHNLVVYDAEDDNRFINNRQYLIKVTNSQDEVWQLRFEYRR